MFCQRRTQASSRTHLLVACSILAAFAVASATHASALGAEHDASRWNEAISAFEKMDREQPVAPGGVVFVGSSSIRLWDLEKSFPGLPAVNRGFGGSQVADAVAFADRIIIPYKPRVVVVYSGGNDVNAGKSPEQVAADFKTLAEKILAAVPKTDILYLSIRPSPKRWAIVDQERATNRLIAEYAKSDERVHIIDMSTIALGDDGLPRKELYSDDMLHLNDHGYEIWSAVLRPELERVFKADR